MADSTSKLPSGEEKENSSCMESSDQMEPENLNTDNHSSDVLQNNHCTAGTNDMKTDCGTELPSSGGDGHDSSEPECGAELGSVPLALLKKDDSGIDVERSPVKEPGGSDESESGRTDSDTGPGLKADSGTGPSGRPSTSNESEGLVADIDSDEADAAADETANVAALRMSDTDSGSEPIAVTTARKRRRGAQRDGSPSPSDERAGPGEESVPGWSSSSDDDDEGQGEEEMEVDPAFPKDTWHPLAEVHRREIGYSNSTHMPFLYRRRCAGSVHLVRRLQLQHKMTYHEGCVNALHFNKSGTLLASGSDDLNIVLWDWVNNKPFLVFDSGHRSNVFQSKFVPYSGDTHVVSCARDGQIRLAELSSTGVCKATKKLAQHRGAAHKLALLQDSAHELYSCGEDAVTFHLDLRQDRPNKLCTTKEGDRKVALYSIHAHPFRTEEYCVGGRDHFVRIYDKRMINETVNNGVMKKFCPLHLVNSDVKANVTCAVYSYNGEELLGTYNDEDIYLFRGDHSDGAGSVHRYTGHRNNATVKGVNFYGPRSEFIVSGSDCSNVFIWEKESEKIVQYFHADDGGVVNVLEPHPHAPILATSGLDHDVKVWTPTAQEASKLPGLARVTRRNTKERDEERENEPDMIDGQMLWLLMQHLRRSARRRARNEGEDLSSSSSEHSDRHDDEEDNDDGDGDAEMGESMQCVPS